MRTVATLRDPVRAFIALRWQVRGARGPPRSGVCVGP
jgi:hypothetical protein